MNHKVLLADDSLTIQKVIKITLANQPYDITECSSEEELFEKLPLVQPKVVFLDFNLSDKFTGYELTTKIKSLLPSTKVLLLLGTFDTVDEAALEKCGASDKIVKPFDSNKFIAITKQLIDTFIDDDSTPPQAKEPAKVPQPEDQWTVTHSTEHKLKTPESPAVLASTKGNALDREISDWGMSIPGVINEKESSDKMIDLPPVIGEAKPAKTEEEAKYPETDDLDYPSMGSSDSSAKLISIESFNEKPMALELEGSYVPNESNFKEIEEQIRDEVEEDLWVADEFEDLKKEVSSKIEEVKSSFQPSRSAFDESLFKPLDEGESFNWAETQSNTGSSDTFATNFSKEEIRREMEDMVKKYVKEYMDQLFQKNTEKVAWEVIPDLAENLIRQELVKISNKIINDL
jgi:CheY-like chemotaxis protein